MEIHPGSKPFAGYMAKLVRFFKGITAVSFVVLGVSACGQEKNVMNQPAALAGTPIVLKNNPASAESVVLGMGCFWGAESGICLQPTVIYELLRKKFILV